MRRDFHPSLTQMTNTSRTPELKDGNHHVNVDLNMDISLRVYTWDLMSDFSDTDENAITAGGDLVHW
jgi:hypothetical protein